MDWKILSKFKDNPNDDNMDEVIPVFLGYHVDKEKAGLEITIIK